MIKEIHLTEIRNYLLSKKLPIDILVEVQDHFVAQISDLHREENLGFEEAFEKIKMSWEKELKPYWKGEISLEDTSDFMRKMTKEIDKSNLIFALKFSTIPLFIIIVFAYIFNATMFGYATLFLLSLLVGFSIFHYFKNYQDFRLAKKYTNHILTLHQQYIFLYFVILSPIMNIFSRFLENPEKYQKIITFYTDQYSISNYFFVFISLFIIIFGVFFSLSAQRNYLRQIQKVKPFLPYLH